MDGHALPLDLTIYGAIHQHQMRKAAGAGAAGMIWQGIHTIKFKKVSGPAPSADGEQMRVRCGVKSWC
jgi:E3 ubiquitin-protein ligase TRIP12